MKNAKAKNKPSLKGKKVPKLHNNFRLIFLSICVIDLCLVFRFYSLSGTQGSLQCSLPLKATGLREYIRPTITSVMVVKVNITPITWLNLTLSFPGSSTTS